MAFVEEKLKPGGLFSGSSNLLEGMKLLKEMQDQNGAKKLINSQLWHACAGPLVNLPHVGSLVYYFPQGHSEQVAVSTNRTATTQIPNYPNLPSQLLCQVHSVTLHADKETDEIYAQMSLQPVNSGKDVFPIPEFGLKPIKHPTEFFCKTLTASDTSTHGGFSIPRRAAEKLFPQLDYSMQPPTQELVVRDLHDNTWTFRHIYRGQPKRHLLTTGWSMFVGAKRLRAGDSVLFIRDEKSQLLLGVRRVNRQQAKIPSSVLSADSMHIGIIAAAAHAASNRTQFSIFYNPRACPSEFVIPLAKFRKSVHGAQLSNGMRFGMMFETEESNKRRYMGTILGVSDLDPLKWPNSKWRSLQVEWDEPGCVDKQTRVSPWEIETPESLFVFPSLKRPFNSTFVGAQREWEYLINTPFLQVPDSSNVDLQCPSVSSSLWSEQLLNMLIKPSPIISPSMQQVKDSATEKPKSLIVPYSFPQGENHPQSSNNGQQVDPLQVEPSSDQYPSQVKFNSDSLPMVKTMDQEFWDPNINNATKCVSYQNLHVLEYNSSHNPSDMYSCLNLDGSNSGSAIMDPSVSNTLLDDFCEIKTCDFQNPSDYLVDNLCLNQDLQSQITSAASLADSQTFSLQEYADNSGGASSSNVEFDDNNLLHHSSWQQVTPRFRTYTKIQKAGSVGRSIDVSSFKYYDELRFEIERMFGLEGMLNDSGSGWKLVYVDFENDVLLVGDDPWEEFVGCVKCIRILSPLEVKQMGEEGMQLINSAGLQGVTQDVLN